MANIFPACELLSLEWDPKVEDGKKQALEE